MQSHSERRGADKPASRQALDTAMVWNRKGHFYLGLYFLFFLWLFAFTGLLLNHESWKFAEFWPSRKVSRWERPVQVQPLGTDVEQAASVMKELGIRGEVEWTAVKPGSTALEFRVNRPGHNFTVAYDRDLSRVRVEHIELNGWGVLRVLHTFTGARAGDARNERDWLLTQIWAFAMDAVAAGMVVMVLSGLWLWWSIPSKRMLGGLALLLGVASCWFLVVGLRWIYAGWF